MLKCEDCLFCYYYPLEGVALLLGNSKAGSYISLFLPYVADLVADDC